MTRVAVDTYACGRCDLVTNAVRAGGPTLPGPGAPVSCGPQTQGDSGYHCIFENRNSFIMMIIG